ncbi:hypothetical protein CROQUDRAFT_100270 [Cronartium quercuum f. sp. fusiforme G11]|uniref:Uncharacterized protein n=1 Tax=Cronartium quercuum f. sp. fusiforme G11 TaxID=708437 RepID=A0A9P6N9W2_9BASI|nr:hypothetical protein CROQUDRAFT_100270 [Cronartium quercuum f. sp. fusiforme G11]
MSPLSTTTLPPPTTCTVPHYPASSTLQIQSHPPITTASLHSTPPPLAYPLLTLDPITSDLYPLALIAS